jgi:hypothetical protein
MTAPLSRPMTLKDLKKSLLMLSVHLEEEESEEVGNDGNIVELDDNDMDDENLSVHWTPSSIEGIVVVNTGYFIFFLRSLPGAVDNVSNFQVIFLFMRFTYT